MSKPLTQAQKFALAMAATGDYHRIANGNFRHAHHRPSHTAVIRDMTVRVLTDRDLATVIDGTLTITPTGTATLATIRKPANGTWPTPHRRHPSRHPYRRSNA